ncbi:hypothetical protein [Salinispira pacifica]
MFELPELTVLSAQINGVLTGKVVRDAVRGNSPHKFVWYNRTEDEFRSLAMGRRVASSYVKGRWLFLPLEPGFTYGYFASVLDDPSAAPGRSVKALLTQDQTIPGLGNAVAQDIMFNARLHPRRPVRQLDGPERRRLYEAIAQTVQEVIDAGGRNDERDLFDRPGGYRRLMDSAAAGNPCPRCGAPVAKISYLGGTCYFCPDCQRQER